MILVDKWENDNGKEMMTFVDGDTVEFTTNKKRFPALHNAHIGQVWRFKLYTNESVRAIPNMYSWQPQKLKQS